MLSAHIVAWLFFYRYTILYPLAIIEGPVLMLFCGILVRLGFFAFWPTYLLLMAGDLTGDIVWYAVGQHGARPLIEKYGRFLNINDQELENLEKLFQKNHMKILFISKITMGFGFALATLIAAGAAKVPFKKYIAANFAGQFVWTAVLLGVGFFFGNFFAMVNTGLRWAFAGAFLVIALAAVYGFGKAMQKRLKLKIESI